MSRLPAWAVAVTLLSLAALHHDFWLWDDGRLLGGWLPIGLAWHVGYAFAASAVWIVIVRWAWPGEEGDAS